MFQKRKIFGISGGRFCCNSFAYFGKKIKNKLSFFAEISEEKCGAVFPAEGIESLK